MKMGVIINSSIHSLSQFHFTPFFVQQSTHHICKSATTLDHDGYTQSSYGIQTNRRILQKSLCYSQLTQKQMVSNYHLIFSNLRLVNDFS